MVRVLVTCVGSGVGQSVLDSLNELREDYIIGCDMNRDVYATHFCDEFHFIPSLYSKGYTDFILNLAIDRKADIIIPGHDHELLLMSKEIEKFNANGIQVIVSEPTIINISRDKYMWYEYFNNRGCSIVPTYKVIDFKKQPDSSVFPAIIKPVGGSASQGISIVHDISELETSHDNDIIQPYLFPVKGDDNYDAIVTAVNNRKFVQMSEISIQLIFGKDAKFKAIFISKNVLRNGVPVHVDPIQPEDFEYLDEIMKFVPICEEKGVMGPVNVQGRITEKGILFFEMNMRFTGITGNRAQLGFNEVKYLVDNYIGKESSLMGYTKNKVGVRQVACATINRTPDSRKPRIITILGGGGYFGTHFIESIVNSAKYEKVVLVARESSFIQYKEQFNNVRIQVYSSNDSLIQSVYNQTDVLVNFASALANQADKKKYEAILYQFEQSQKIATASIPLVINISSQSVYNQTLNKLKTEDDATSIESSYSFQKYLCEQFYRSSRAKYPLSRSISLRFPRIVGDGGLKENGFFQKMLSSLINKQKVSITNPQNNTTLLHVNDAVSAINFIINNEEDYPEVMNVGGVNVSMEEYAKAALKYTKADSSLLELTPTTTSEVSSQVDTTLFNSFGWSYKTGLETIIKSMLNNVLVQ